MDDFSELLEKKVKDIKKLVGFIHRKKLKRITQDRGDDFHQLVGREVIEGKNVTT